MSALLEHLAHVRDNDYTALEEMYHTATGGEPVSDSFGALRCGPTSPLTSSVVISAWNARHTGAVPSCDVESY
jgi:hypothetical protein